MSKETFVELRHQALDHSFMLFVEGVELSAYVVGSIEWVKSGRSGPNTLSVSLTNAGNVFLMTALNLSGTWAVGTGPYSEAAKKQIYQSKMKGNGNVVDKLTGEPRWPFHEHKPVLHHNDRIRLMVKHPFREDSWYPAFVGFITSYPWEEDYLTGISNIRIQAEDIRHIMESMRIRTNAISDTTGKLTTPEAIFSGEAGIFRDLELSPAFTHILAGLSFPEIMAFLLTGGAAYGIDNSTIRSFGVGQLSDGLLYEVTPGTNSSFAVAVKDFTPSRDQPKKRNGSLEEWTDLCLFGAFGEPLTTQEAQAVGLGTTTGGVWDPAAGKVHYLLPAADTAFTDLVQFGKLSTSEHERSWQSRLSLVEEIIERIGYEWRVTGIGDIVFEFPMSDFMPQFFGRYESALTVDHHLKNFSMDPESGDLVTALTATGGFTYAEDPRQSISGPNPQIFFPKTWVVAQVMAARVGARADTISYPHVHDVKLLCLFTLVNFFRRLAKTNQISAPFVYRLPLEPNRPLLVVQREKMATIDTISYSLEIDTGSATMTASLTMPRDRRDDGTYRFITGGQAGPVTYRRFEGIGELISASSGLVVKCEQGPDVLKIKQEAASEILGLGPLKGNSRGAAGGLTRDEIRALAARLGATEDEIIAAIVINSEDPAGSQLAQEAIVHTLINRTQSQTVDKAADVWSAAVGRRNATTGKQAGRPYSTARPPTNDKLWARRIETARTAIADHAAGKDPVEGATRFNHPRGFPSKAEAERVDQKWKAAGYKRVIAQKDGTRTNDKIIRIYKYDP